MTSVHPIIVILVWLAILYIVAVYISGLLAVLLAIVAVIHLASLL